MDYLYRKHCALTKKQAPPPPRREINIFVALWGRAWVGDGKSHRTKNREEKSIVQHNGTIVGSEFGWQSAEGKKVTVVEENGSIAYSLYRSMMMRAYFHHSWIEIFCYNYARSRYFPIKLMWHGPYSNEVLGKKWNQKSLLWPFCTDMYNSFIVSDCEWRRHCDIWIKKPLVWYTLAQIRLRQNTRLLIWIKSGSSCCDA